MSEREYVLGTHDEEIARLDLQHRVWRPHALEAWRAAGFAAGQTIIDVGCGPGFAALDLAEIVGATGRVIAVDKSRRFLDALASMARGRGIVNIDCHEIDLDRDALPDVTADGAWARWAFAFVRDPRRLLNDVAARVRGGGAIAFNEYLDYRTWRTSPRSPELDEFVDAVIKSWRDSGGEPDIASDLLRWLPESGCHEISTRPLIDFTRRGDDKWRWLTAFIESGRRRLVDLGVLDRERSEALGTAVAEWNASPTPPLMISPAVLEIIARRSPPP